MMTEILNSEDTQFVLFMGIMSPENESGTQDSSWKCLKGLGSALQSWSWLEFYSNPINLKCLFMIVFWQYLKDLQFNNWFYLQTQQLEDCKVVRTMMNGTKP